MPCFVHYTWLLHFFHAQGVVVRWQVKCKVVVYVSTANIIADFGTNLGKECWTVVAVNKSLTVG